MKKKLRILIVDDHPMIVEAYKNLLSSSDLSDYRFLIDTANDIDTAIKKIVRSVGESTPYNLLFFDVKLPPSSDGEIISGEGLAVFAREKLPFAKIVILTMFNETFRIHNILKTVNPDGLLIKNDLTSKEFLIAFNAIMYSPPYYSATVVNYFRNQSLNSEGVVLDDINRKIIFYLSKGIKTKNLPNYINLSLSAIEKRKNQIRNLLKLDEANDETIIEEAQKRGFV